MQQFTVPQFIDVEDKILGPITSRQFMIMLSGSLVIFVFYKILTQMYFILGSLTTFIITMVFAFVRINGRPFHFFVLNFVQTIMRPMLRVWNMRQLPIVAVDEIVKENTETTATPPKRRYSASRLAELSLIVDTQGAFRGDVKASTIKRDRNMKNQKDIF